MVDAACSSADVIARIQLFFIDHQLAVKQIQLFDIGMAVRRIGASGVINCAPAGYYGPEWFNGGVFIGAGRWFHGDNEFRGHVNNRFHPDHGYRGPTPKAGERADESKRVDSRDFKGNEVRDGRGHVAKEKR